MPKSALAWFDSAVQSGIVSGPAAPPHSLSALNVPYVPQKRALCGGAAVEMVLRFWGARGIYAGDFETLVDASAGGIHTDRLAAAVRERGWHATPFEGSLEFLAFETGHGRPVVALIEVAPDRYHYVVVTRASPAAADGPEKTDDARVVYHDACHLAHGHGVRAEPRALLQAIPRVELLTPAECEICCGSAGIYNLVQPGPAAELGARKARHIAALSPDMIATGNPGCTLQIAAAARGLGHDWPIVHPIELLDASIRGVDPRSDRGR